MSKKPRGPEGQTRPTDANLLGHEVIGIATGFIKEKLPDQQKRKAGLVGGKARALRLTKAERTEIAKKGGQVTRKKSLRK